MHILWHFWAISDPHEGPGGNFSGSKWPQRTILDVSHPDPLKSSHLEPTEPLMAINGRLWYFLAISDPRGGPRGQFQWVQMAPTDHPGCIPPRSNQYPLRSSHLEPPEPLMAINGRFMAFSGSLWPLNRHKRPNVDVPKLDLHPT